MNSIAIAIAMNINNDGECTKQKRQNGRKKGGGVLGLGSVSGSVVVVIR